MIELTERSKFMDIRAFWKFVLKQDRAMLKTFFADDAVIRWHCTDEEYTVDEYITANCEYSGIYDGHIERIDVSGDLITVAVQVFPIEKTSSYHVVSFIKVKDDKIVEMDEYWSDDGKAPAFRQALHIGKPIQSFTRVM